MDFNKHKEYNNEYTQRPVDYLDTKIGRFNKDESVLTIYVGNLSFAMDEIDIKELFEEFGHVHYVKLIKDKVTHNSKGIAFVQMPHANQGREAIKVLNGEQVDGRVLKVSIAVENNERAKETLTKSVKVKKRRKPYKAYVSKAKRATLAAE